MKNAFVSLAAVAVATVFALYTPHASAQKRCGDPTFVSFECWNGETCGVYTNPIDGSGDNAWLNAPINPCSTCISPIYVQDGQCFFNAKDELLLNSLEKNHEQLAGGALAVPTCDGAIALLVPFEDRLVPFEDRRHAM